MTPDPTSRPVEPMAGELVTEVFEYDGGRRVTVYVPPGPPEAVVVAGDGQEVARWGGLLETPDVPPALIVGIHAAGTGTLRLHEYSPVLDPTRFESHRRFVVDDVTRWARSRFGLSLPPERTAVFGASAGGELALALGLRYPELFPVVLSGSPGAGYRPPSPLPDALPATYLVAGTGEPFFLDNATRWATALRDAGGEVVLAERAGTHGSALWRAEFPLMVAWAFGR